MNRVDIAMGLLDRVKIVVVVEMVVFVVSVDVVVDVVVSVDVVVNVDAVVINVVVICLSTTYTGLTSQWVCWTRRRWSFLSSALMLLLSG